MAKETKTLQIELPADNTLTSDNFKIDADGNVVIKNAALKALLKEKLQPAVNDANTNAISVGVTVGT